MVDVAVACGVELDAPGARSGRTRRRSSASACPIPKTYFGQYEFTSQFEGAERIADKWGITRADTDAFGLAVPAAGGHRPGPRAASTARSSPVDAPDLDDEGKPTGTTHRVARDEGLRETTLEALANLKPVARDDGVHTAGTSSQISDGAAAVLMMTAEKAAALGPHAAGPRRRHLPRRRRPRAHAHRARSTPPSACSSAPA